MKNEEQETNRNKEGSKNKKKVRTIITTMSLPQPSVLKIRWKCPSGPDRQTHHPQGVAMVIRNNTRRREDYDVPSEQRRNVAAVQRGGKRKVFGDCCVEQGVFALECTCISAKGILKARFHGARGRKSWRQVWDDGLMLQFYLRATYRQ